MGMFTIYLHTKFHMPKSSSSLLIKIKQKKEILTRFPCHYFKFCRNVALKSATFFEDMLPFLILRP